jgi:predicted transposase/invertase (TIGR01784 family)
VYLLFEHKSYPERLIAFQLLRYVVRIWEMVLQQGEGLAPIVPVVVYHGRVRWEIAASLQELVGVPEALTPYVPDYRYCLCDLSRYTDEEIRGAVVLRATLLALKHIFQPDLRERLPAVIRLVAELGERGTGLEYLETLLRYVSSAAETLTEEDLREVVEEVLAQEGGMLMSTIAEKWVEQGMQRGMQQGMQRGLEQGLVSDAQEAVVDVWEARFGEVPVEALQVIGRLDNLIVLRQLRKKAATAGSAQELVQAIRALPAGDNGDQGEG